MKNIIKAVTILVIGGTVYTVSQTDIVDNFSREAGLSQQEAEQYIENIPEDELASFDEIGDELISDGQYTLSIASGLDCLNYYYEWETSTLSCDVGKSQLTRIGNSEIALGRAYKVLDTEEATEDDISIVIRNIDRLNTDFELEIVTTLLDPPTIDEMKKTNLYNKALLQAALDSK